MSDHHDDRIIREIHNLAHAIEHLDHRIERLECEVKQILPKHTAPLVTQATARVS